MISIVRKIKEKRKYYNLKKSNIFDLFPEKNHFGNNSHLLYTKWGRYSGCNSNCDIAYTEVGNYCQLAPGVVIGPRNHIFTNFTINDFPYLNNEQEYALGDGMFQGYFNKIGNDVWIGR